MFLQRQADQKKINQLNATVHELEVGKIDFIMLYMH